MPTAEKEATVAELTDILKRAKGLYLTDFTGLDVPSFTLLRKQLREESVSYLVIKNRLAKLAVKQAGVEGLDDVFRGPTGLVCADEDPVAPARVLTKFAEETDGKPRLKPGISTARSLLQTRLSDWRKYPRAMFCSARWYLQYKAR